MQVELWTLRFLSQILGFILKKLKLGRAPPHVDGPLRKNLKHQIEVDNNPGWLVPVSFSTIICIEINRGVSFFLWTTEHKRNLQEKKNKKKITDQLFILFN